METIDERFIKLRKQYLEKRFHGLNDRQREAVFATEGPLLILAGAGSGKTTVLVHRIANLILYGHSYHSNQLARAVEESDIEELETCIDKWEPPSAKLTSLLAVNPVRPWNILAITFTNKAAEELKHRLASILGDEIGGDVNASTFHSACVRILRREADKIGFPTNFTIYDTDDQKRVLKEVYKNNNIDEKFLGLRAAASAIGRLKDKMISPAEAAAGAADPRAQLVAQIYAAYAKRCRASGAMDFDDLIYYTARLLQEHSQTRAYYQNRFKYIHVDEYQDTSVAQFLLVNLLCDASNNVCVVGDDDQSIYRFRGATIENILSFEARFPGATVIRLEQNYRSTSHILDAANCVIRNNEGRKGKTLWTDNGAGEKVQHYMAANEQDEAAYIAGVIERHLLQGVPLRDHAILYRMNAQSSPIETYFTLTGIPHKIVGGLRFNDRKEVRDIHAYMSIVVSPQDDLRLQRIINEPSRKIGNTTVASVAEIAAGLGVPMLEVVRDAADYPAFSTRAVSVLRKFYDLYESLVEAQATLPLDEFASFLIETTGYQAMLEAQGDEGLTRLENLGQLVSNVKTYMDLSGDEASLAGYLEEIALISDIDNYDENIDQVVLMTLHSAKGLEFPYVFIVGMEEGIFPGEQSRWQQEDLEEERRLCYVGITRAKKELYLISADSRVLYGQTRRNDPSQFIDEIDPALVDTQESAVGVAAKTDFFSPQPSSPPPKPEKKPRNKIIHFPGSTSASGEPKKQNNTGAAFAPGDRVEHRKFGRGVIESVNPVAGDCILEIRFDEVGLKKTMANYTPLKKL